MPGAFLSCLGCCRFLGLRSALCRGPMGYEAFMYGQLGAKAEICRRI